MDKQPYHPAPGVLKQLHDVDFVAVVGPTAVGKTTLMNAAVVREPKLAILMSGVSRAPRPGEKDGVDYHFGTKEAMGERVETGGYVTAVHGASGDWYTTAPEDYPKGKVAMMAVLAHAMPMFRALPLRSFRTIFILPPGYEVWQERLHRHEFNADELRQRLVEAERSLVFGLEDEATHFVLNDSVDVAAEDLALLATGRPLPARLQADQSRGRQLAGELLEQLRRVLGATRIA